MLRGESSLVGVSGLSLLLILWLEGLCSCQMILYKYSISDQCCSKMFGMPKATQQSLILPWNLLVQLAHKLRFGSSGFYARLTIPAVFLKYFSRKFSCLLAKQNVFAELLLKTVSNFLCAWLQPFVSWKSFLTIFCCCFFVCLVNGKPELECFIR